MRSASSRSVPPSARLRPSELRRCGSYRLTRQRDSRMCDTLQAVHRAHRVRNDARDGLGFIDDPVDERRVRAVLEQSPDEVRQQVLVLTDGRVDAARYADPVRPRDLGVQALTHAVQALEFECPPGAPGHVPHGRHRVRVVRGELRVEAVRALLQDQPGAGKVRDVRVRLAREHRVPGQATFLAALDLRVPVRALDEPHVQHPARLRREAGEIPQRRLRALLVGLDRDAEAGPLGEARRPADRLDQFERELQALRLLGVERERNAGVTRADAQLDQSRSRARPARDVGAHARTSDAARRA